jgi:hypothetical protein
VILQAAHPWTTSACPDTNGLVQQSVALRSRYTSFRPIPMHHASAETRRTRRVARMSSNLPARGP